MENEKLKMKEGKKRYGMSQSGMMQGYECCEGGMEEADEALVEVAQDEPKFGGFLTRNNTWERI